MLFRLKPLTITRPSLGAIMMLLERINELGTTVLVVTHEKNLVNRFTKRVVAIENGRIRSPSILSRFTASRVKEPIMIRQATIMHTAAKDIKPWVKMEWTPSLM